MWHGVWRRPDACHGYQVGAGTAVWYRRCERFPSGCESEIVKQKTGVFSDIDLNKMAVVISTQASTFEEVQAYDRRGVVGQQKHASSIKATRDHVLKVFNGIGFVHLFCARGTYPPYIRARPTYLLPTIPSSFA